jgi:hypothetical protein
VKKLEFVLDAKEKTEARRGGPRAAEMADCGKRLKERGEFCGRGKRTVEPVSGIIKNGCASGRLLAAD